MQKILTAIICFFVLTSASYAAKADKKAAKKDMKAAPVSTEKCTTQFPYVLLTDRDPKLDLFEEESEYFVERTRFWQDCLRGSLIDGKDAVIHFTAYTKDDKPNMEEGERAVRAAVEFKEELEDYIEDVQEHTNMFNHPKRFIKIQEEPNKAPENLGLLKMLKRELRHFNEQSSAPKIIIHVDYMKAPTANLAGNINISVN